MKIKSCPGARTEQIRTTSALPNGIDAREHDRRAEQGDPGRSLSSAWSSETARSEIMRDLKPYGRLDTARTENGVRESLKTDVAPSNGSPSRNMNGSPSGNIEKELAATSALGSVLDGLRGVPTVCSNGSDVLIVVVLAENACGCAGFDQDGLQGRRPRRITIDGCSMTPTIIQTLRVSRSDSIGAQGGELLATVTRALERHEQSKQALWREDDVATPFASLTLRQREIMDLVLAGHPNKIIAADLGISQRTVENHRASIMQKTGAKSLAALVRLAMVAERAAQAARTAQH
jgi:DNA-binding CsgD family transcriptional regulator